MATNFMIKSAKSAYSPTFLGLAFQNGVAYRNSDFKNFIGDDLARGHSKMSLF